MTARLGVATLDKGMAIACEPRLDPNRHWDSECRLIRVRVSNLQGGWSPPALHACNGCSALQIRQQIHNDTAVNRLKTMSDRYVDQ